MVPDCASLQSLTSCRTFHIPDSPSLSEGIIPRISSSMHITGRSIHRSTPDPSRIVAQGLSEGGRESTRASERERESQRRHARQCTEHQMDGLDWCSGTVQSHPENIHNVSPENSGKLRSAAASTPQICTSMQAPGPIQCLGISLGNCALAHTRLRG